MSIKILIADDQTLFRQGICSLLSFSNKVEVVSEVDDGTGVIDAINKYKPDVVLLDIRMPVMSGINTLIAMKQAQLSVPTILLTTFDDDELVRQGIEAGAKGFLLKDVSLENLVSAIEIVFEGGTYLQPLVTDKILKGLNSIEAHFDSEIKPEKLSDKELQTLRFLAAGYSNKEISQIMLKAEGTVKNQVSTILSKLGVRDRTRAVLLAIKIGLIGNSSAE